MRPQTFKIFSEKFSKFSLKKMKIFFAVINNTADYNLQNVMQYTVKLIQHLTHALSTKTECVILHKVWQGYCIGFDYGCT